MISNHDDRDFGWTQILIANSVSKCWSATAGDARPVAASIVFRSTTFARGADWVMTQTEI
jgi:hypothetical protein